MIAVAVFAYRRASQLAEMLETLNACVGFADTQVILFVDGPKGHADSADVLAARNVVSSLAWPNLQYNFSDTNKGLRRSIAEGVTLVLSRYERIIVLEEDLLLSPVALEFFATALDRYAADERVWSVSGYMYDVEALRDRKEALALPFAHPWGWATWRRAWEKFDPLKPIPFELMRSRSFRERFNLSGLADFTQMLRLAEEGLINSWYIRWYYRIFLENGLSIFPPRSYVRNAGIGGGYATHGSSFNLHRALVRPQSLSRELVWMPAELEIDFLAIDHIRDSWDARAHRLGNALGAIKRRLRK